MIMAAQTHEFFQVVGLTMMFSHNKELVDSNRFSGTEQLPHKHFVPYFVGSQDIFSNWSD